MSTTPARSRQGSVTSAMPPKTPLTGPDSASVKARSRQGSVASQAQAVSKQDSRVSLKSAGGESSPAPASPAVPANPPSAASGAASAAPAPETSPVAAPSDSGALARQPSQLSVHSQGTARQSNAEVGSEVPQREPTPEGSVHSERAATPQAFVSEPQAPSPPSMAGSFNEARDVNAELAEAKTKIYNLEQQNASLQRLMSSGSGETKIKMLTQDLNKRSERIKALEAEVRKQTKRAEDAEAKAKLASTKERRASRSSMNVSDKGSAQDKAVIKDLQSRLHEMEAKLADSKVQRHDSGRPVSFPAGGGHESQAAIFKLQTHLAEKEAENQMLQQKLTKAQAAIVSSAGAGFENEVKLQQAKTALQSILRSQSPQHSRGPSSSMPRGTSASPLSHLSASPTLTQYASKPKAYYESLANPYSSASRASPTGYTGLSQPRSVSPTRQFMSQY